MPNLNKVMLMGNLTRDPELRYTPNNNAVANIGLAVNRRWKSSEGERQEETTFVDCEAWGRTAEVMNQYLSKGRPVFIEGRLKLDQWQDQQGNNRSKLRVVIESASGGGGYQQNRAPARQSAPAGSPPAGEPHHSVEDDDIPF